MCNKSEVFLAALSHVASLSITSSYHMTEHHPPLPKTAHIQHYEWQCFTVETYISAHIEK